MQKFLPFGAMLSLMAVVLGSVASIDYMVTVQQPVTLVTSSLAVRQNGTCCSPGVPMDCTVCAGDPDVEFRLFVCFRPGFIPNLPTDTSNCPLGATTFTPNQPPMPQSALTPRVEAASLEREYSGSVQLAVSITAVINNGSMEMETTVDHAWVFGFELPADGVFRRISRLSVKGVFIVSVNTLVMCTNGTQMPNCSLLQQGTETAATATTEELSTDRTAAGGDGTTQEPTAAGGDGTTQEPTADFTDTDTTPSGAQQGGPGDASTSKFSSGVGIVIGLCVGVFVTGILSLLLLGFVIACLRKKHKMNIQETASPLVTAEGNNVHTTRKAEEDKGHATMVTQNPEVKGQSGGSKDDLEMSQNPMYEEAKAQSEAGGGKDDMEMSQNPVYDEATVKSGKDDMEMSQNPMYEEAKAQSAKDDMEMSQNPVYEAIVDKAPPDVVVMSQNPVATINKTQPESLLSNDVPDEGEYVVASLDEQPSNDLAHKIDNCVPDVSPYEVAS